MPFAATDKGGAVAGRLGMIARIRLCVVEVGKP
jgi:hypothetical protein